MLARLISARQVVVLYQSGHLILFYSGQAYIRPTREGFDYVPLPRGENKHPVWALINCDSGTCEPTLYASDQVWPIQASTPDPIRWRTWSKRLNAARWGLPLWTIDELVFGYVFRGFLSRKCLSLSVPRLLCSFQLQWNYSKFRNNLEKALRGEPTCARYHRVMDRALEVLKAEKEKGDPDILDDAVQDENVPDPVDAAIKVLIGDVVANHGFSPRDVYVAIYEPFQARYVQTNKILLFKFDELQNLIRSFLCNFSISDNSSHDLISISPSERFQCPTLDTWTIGFKSIRIAKEVVVSMRWRTCRRLRQMYGSLHRFSEASSLLGCVFEALVHRMLCEGSWSGRRPNAIPMHSDGKEPPSFSTTAPSAFGCTSLPALHGPRKNAMIDLTRSLDDFEPNGKMYYIPTATNDPLFDSFAITFDDSRFTALISVFQMSISDGHGSTKGYGLIRKIMSRVQEVKPGFKIRVVYWLVCPSWGPSEERVWKMPDGWDTNTMVDDHRGDVFCLSIPIKVCRLRSPPRII